MIICKNCKRHYEYSKKKGHTKTVCNSCTVNKRRVTLKRKSIEYLGGKCIVCGYDKCDRAMSFHHIDPKDKKFGITNAYMKSWANIKKELDKCCLLCSNCHMEVEAGITSFHQVH